MYVYICNGNVQMTGWIQNLGKSLNFFSVVTTLWYILSFLFAKWNIQQDFSQYGESAEVISLAFMLLLMWTYINEYFLRNLKDITFTRITTSIVGQYCFHYTVLLIKGANIIGIGSEHRINKVIIQIRQIIKLKKWCPILLWNVDIMIKQAEIVCCKRAKLIVRPISDSEGLPIRPVQRWDEKNAFACSFAVYWLVMMSI